LKVHFAGVVEQLKRRYGVREESFTKLIEELENDNSQLVDDCGAHEETIAGLRTSLELRDAEITRLQEALESAHVARPVVTQHTQHVHPLFPNANVLVEYCASMIEAQHLQYAVVTEAVTTFFSRSACDAVEALEASCRALTEEMESEVFPSIVREFQHAAALQLSSRDSYRSLCRKAVGACVQISATQCLQHKGVVVAREDTEWSALYDAWEAACTGTDALITLEEPSTFGSMFWDCCLEEAQVAIQALPVPPELGAMREVCAADLPKLLQAARSSVSSTEVLQLWSRTVASPLHDVLEGREALTQLYSNIHRALETLRQ
jgi:hypothetical protein